MNILYQDKTWDEYEQEIRINVSGPVHMTMLLANHLAKQENAAIIFVSTDGAGLRVKVDGRLAENTRTKLIGVIPALDAGEWKVEVKTQYAGLSDTELKTPRVVESVFTLTVEAVP